MPRVQFDGMPEQRVRLDEVSSGARSVRSVMPVLATDEPSPHRVALGATRACRLGATNGARGEPQIADLFRGISPVRGATAPG